MHQILYYEIVKNLNIQQFIPFLQKNLYLVVIGYAIYYYLTNKTKVSEFYKSLTDIRTDYCKKIHFRRDGAISCGYGVDFCTSNENIFEAIVNYMERDNIYLLNASIMAEIKSVKVGKMKELKYSSIPMVDVKQRITETIWIKMSEEITNNSEAKFRTSDTYMYIYSCKSMKDIDDFIRRALEYRDIVIKNVKDEKTRFYYTIVDMKEKMFQRTKLSYKSIDSLFIPDKKSILEQVMNFNNFVRRDKKRDEMDIKDTKLRRQRNKLCILMEGLAGCGKTSTSKIIASMTERHIINLDLKSIKSDEELFRLYFHPNVKYQNSSEKICTSKIEHKDLIFVMEDIDCISDIVKKRDNVEEKKEKKEEKKEEEKDSDMIKMMKLMVEKEEDKKIEVKQKGLTLAGLLNVLDGVVEAIGVITIMTTNRKHILDPALIRPGRVDIELNYGRMRTPEIEEMLQYYYPNSPLIDVSEWDGKYTPAELERICMKHEEIENFVREVNSLGKIL